MSQALKPFLIDLADVAFILYQVTFPTIKIIRYDASGAAIFGYVDKSGNTHELGPIGAFDPTLVIYDNPSDPTDPLNNLPLYNGPRDYQGLRNVTGFLNNLIDGQQTWGATDSLFLRLVPHDYSHYVQENLANAALNPRPTPSSPMIRSRMHSSR